LQSKNQLFISRLGQANFISTQCRTRFVKMFVTTLFKFSRISRGNLTRMWAIYFFKMWHHENVKITTNLNRF